MRYNLHLCIFRNKQPSRPLEIIKDDGILLHLVMVLRDISQAVDLSLIRKKSAAKHLTFITLLIQNSTTVTEKWLRSTFQSFWKMWILNVAISHSEKGGNIVTYRYDPFSAELKRRVFSRGHFVDVDDLFPRTMLNMRLRPLRICMYPDDIRSIFLENGRVIGTDGLMTSYLAERLNATPLFHHIGTYGNVSISQDLCFRESVDEIDDVAGNMRFLSLASFYGRVEHTIVLSRDDLCVLVPKAQIAPTFWNLFRSFSCQVWILISVTLILAYLFCLIIYRNIFAGDKLMLDLLACIISTPRAKLHRPMMSSRLFLCVWLVYGLLISAAFKGNLTSNLVDREYLPDVDSLQELAQSSYPLACLPRHLKHMNRYLDPKNPFEALLRKKIEVIPDLHFRKLMDDNNLSYAYLQKYHVSVFRANSRRHSVKGKPCFHAMSQCIVPFHAVYIVPYGSAYLGYINRLMRNAQEYGYLNYWQGLMNAVLRRTRRTGFLHRGTDDQPEVLQLFHFQAAFCLWACGSMLALICFILELVNAKHTF